MTSSATGSKQGSSGVDKVDCTSPVYMSPAAPGGARSKMSPLSFCLLVVVSAAVVNGAPQNKYTTKYDNVNLDQVLGNNRLLSNYFKCLMDQGPCTPDGEELKSHVRDALETGCKKCSTKQRDGIEKVIRFLLKNKPKEFSALEKKYDPKGVYRARYQAEAQKKGIKV